MKTVKSIFILFVIGTTVLSGCHDSDIDDEIVTDPTEAILGKWELVAILPAQGKEEPHEPNGYIEYLSDRTMVWYDHAAKHEILLGTYWIEAGDQVDYWTLNYDLDYETIISNNLYHTDMASSQMCSGSFKGRNQMNLVDRSAFYLTSPSAFIYKRKK